LDEAVRLREEEPRRSTATIIALMERLDPDCQGRISRVTLDRHLRRLGKTRKRLAQARRVLRRFQKACRNDLWVADFCLPALSFRDGDQIQRAILLAIIDHKSRLIVAGGFIPSRQAVHVEQTLKRAIAQYGLPKALFVDNGRELTGSLVAGGCQHLGIRHLRAHVGEPEARGVVERFFRTFQDSFVPEMAAKAMIPTLGELNRFWDAWLEGFYHSRPHAGLGAHPPLSPRQAWEADQTPLRHLDPVTVDGAFLLRESRRVNKTALIAWDGRSYLCDDALVGEAVQIRFHPDRLESVQIWKDDRFLQVACRYLPPTDVPRQEPVPPRPRPQQSLLDLLDAQQQASLKDHLAKLPPAAAPLFGHFTEAAAAALLELHLGRNLEARELDWLAQSWRQAGGFQADLTSRAIALYAARFGTGRHLAYYLEFITTAHLRARHANQGGQAHV
ncbi:MAG TPA: DDE-type integrase/transposase/recombinase, partial [Bacillota bacterium]|nr:DDE-type integrase/transposase/recombinase [Bacillota bacterium]